MVFRDPADRRLSALFQTAIGRPVGVLVALAGVAAIALSLGLPLAFLGVALGSFGLGFGLVLLVMAPAPRRKIQRAALRRQRDAQPPAAPAETVQAFFDSLPVAILRLDERGQVVQSNAAARHLLALRAGEVASFETLVEGLGRSVSSWLQVARDNHDVVKPEMVQASRRRGEAVLQVTLMPPPGGGDGGLVAVLSDATELKTLEAQFVQSQKMQAIGQLAGGVAHDFNNLLTAISGYCDLLLLRHPKGDPDFADLIQINQNANRAASLVAHLLAFSRKQTLSPRALSVNDTVSEMSHLLSRLLGEKVSLSAEYGKGLPRAYVDSRQLEQVIMNLVLNARDAMPDGGEVRLVTGAQIFETNTKVEGVTVPRGSYVTTTVMDSGVGIAAEHRDKIFEPFFSTKEEGKGTGLGLSMVYGIIKQTGGFIFCDSTPGEGTEFRILLPAHDGRETQHEEASEQKSPPRALSGLNLLLVEDEAPVRSFAARALKMHGVQVYEAENAEEALERIVDQNLAVDIVVSDVVMPGMDGPTWVRAALEKRPGLKVIFVSGYAEESFSEEYPDIPHAAFLPKPFTLKDLIEEVRKLAE